MWRKTFLKIGIKYVIYHGNKCYEEKENQKKGRVVLDKGIQFGEGIERIIEPMASEQRYLTAATVLSMGRAF